MPAREALSGPESARLDRRLAKARRDVQRAVERTEAAKAELLEAVRQAVAAGYSIARVAQALGVSKGRAQQLVRQAGGLPRSSR